MSYELLTCGYSPDQLIKFTTKTKYSMNQIQSVIRRACGPLFAVLAALLLSSCKSGMDCCVDDKSAMEAPKASTAAAAATAPAAPSAPAVAAAAVAPTAPAAAAPAAAPVRPTIRINAGGTAPYTDAEGNVWVADQGFEEGDTIDRANDLPIANTKDPSIYRTERYSMKSFSQALPNGKYIVKLHFAETFEGIGGAGERVFSFNVEGKEFKDFDIWAKAGGGQKAYIETVETDITDGKLDVTFTSNVENPAINGIEIIPAP
jgi:hypothetical protein